MCIYARSKDRSNIEGISNALELLTRDQLHIVFLQILLRRNRKSRNRAVRRLKRLHLYFTYAGFVILAVEEEVVVVFFLLFRHFLTYASIRCAIFLGLISPVLLWHICNVTEIMRFSHLRFIEIARPRFSQCCFFNC